MIATSGLSGSDLIAARDGLMIWAMNQIVGFRALQSEVPVADAAAARIAELEAQLAAAVAQVAGLKEVVAAQAIEINSQAKTIVDFVAKLEKSPRRTVLINGVLTKVAVENKVEDLFF